MISRVFINLIFIGIFWFHEFFNYLFNFHWSSFGFTSFFICFPDHYTVEESYAKERDLQILQRQNEDLFLTMFTAFSNDG